MPKQILTDLLLRKPPRPQPGKRLDIADEIVTGLVLRVTGRSLSFSYRYRMDGRQYRLSLGSYPQMSLKEARERVRRLKVAQMEGQNPALEKKKEQVKRKKQTMQLTTLRQVVEKFSLHHLPGLAANTQKAYLRELNRHILPLFGSLGIAEIQNEHLIQLYDYLYTELEKPASAKYAQAVLGAVLTYAVDRGYIQFKPVLPQSFKQKLNKANKPRERTYTHAEIRAHWQFADQQLESLVYSSYVKTLYLLGQRRTETAYLRWQDYDPGQGTIQIPAEMAKNNVAHILPVTPMLAELLDELWQQTGSGIYLFSFYSGSVPLDPTGLVQRMREHFGEFQPHDIRRTVSTNLAALGVSADVIDRILNHTPDKLRRTYNRHNYLPQMKEALRLWEKEVKIITRL